MNTVFEFRIRHTNENYARQAAQAAFAEVDRIENLLSRFVEGSDVWRINHAEAGEHVTIGEDCHACLAQAVLMTRATQGAFDVTIGHATDLAKKHDGAKVPAARLHAALTRSTRATVSLDPDTFAVHIIRPGVSIDLGAIGKGYALDRVRMLLAEWEIKHALLSAGDSSVLALGSGGRAIRGAYNREYENIITPKTKPGGWPVNLAGAKQSTPVILRGSSLGGSGTTVQGRHIIDPRRAAQSYTHTRAWTLAPTAAIADALSTACMTMMPAEIALALRELGKGHAVITEDTNGRLHICRRSGVWTQIKPSHVLGWPA